MVQSRHFVAFIYAVTLYISSDVKSVSGMPVHAGRQAGTEEWCLFLHHLVYDRLLNERSGCDAPCPVWPITSSKQLPS
jgi:hypothetical protein